MAPPEDETLEERHLRLEREREAQRVSDMIDEELRQEAKTIKTKKLRTNTVLLLGQSESGKSTFLKRS